MNSSTYYNMIVKIAQSYKGEVGVEDMFDSQEKCLKVYFNIMWNYSVYEPFFAQFVKACFDKKERPALVDIFMRSYMKLEKYVFRYDPKSFNEIKGSIKENRRLFKENLVEKLMSAPEYHEPFCDPVEMADLISSDNNITSQLASGAKGKIKNVVMEFAKFTNYTQPLYELIKGFITAIKRAKETGNPEMMRKEITAVTYYSFSNYDYTLKFLNLVIPLLKFPTPYKEMADWEKDDRITRGLVHGI